MSTPISKTNDEAPILGISIAVLAIVVAVLSWCVVDYIKLQNQNIQAGIQNMEQQIARAQQMDQNNIRLVQLFVGYIQQSKDANNISRVLAPYMQFLPFFGIPVQPGPAPQAGQPAAPAAAPAPAQ